MRKERWRKSAGSTIGRGWRRLRQTTPPSRSAEAAKQPRVAVEVQPQSLPSTIASVTRARPSASISAPGRSGRRLSSCGRSRRRRRPAKTIAGAERQVDEEDEAPVGELDQGAAEGRADRRRGRRGGAPEADAGGAALGREGVENERQRGRRDHRRADPLHDAEGDQQAERGSERAEQAGGGEAGDAEQEDPLVAEAVGEATGRHQQRGDDDEVAVEHPGERVPSPSPAKEREMSGKAMLTIVASRKARKAPAQAIATTALCPRSYIGADYRL